MGFDRVDGLELTVGKEVEEGIEIKSSFTYREVFIALMMVVMKMDFREIFSQRIYPDRKRDPAKNMVMAGVEAESEIGRIDLLEQ